jgi:hypothetical protein
MGVLLMLMTIGGLLVAAILLVVAWINGSAWLGKFVIGGVAIWFAFYTTMLFSFSLFSTEKTLAFNEPKEYCGFYLDCHMHTAVTAVRRTDKLGDRRATGEFYIVTVKVFSNAKRATLGLLTVDAHVVDAGGRTYSRDTLAETELPPQPEFDKKVSPGESFEKEIVFDLPVDVQNPRLDMREGYGIDHVIEAVLVNDEDSFLHKRNYFALDGTQTLSSAMSAKHE